MRLDDVSPDAVTPWVALHTQASRDDIVEEVRLRDADRLVERRAAMAHGRPWPQPMLLYATTSWRLDGVMTTTCRSPWRSLIVSLADVRTSTTHAA